MSVKPLNNVIPVPANPEEMGAITEGLVPLLVAIAVLVAWIAAFLVFGYPGLIIPALVFVALIGGFIVWVSRG